jgi:hypothetical protein
MKGGPSNSRREHMKKRAKERFGVGIGKWARRSLIGKVQAGDVKFVRKPTNSRTLIVAEHAGIEVTFIYSGTSKGIVTFLPAEARETAQWRAALQCE